MNILQVGSLDSIKGGVAIYIQSIVNHIDENYHFYVTTDGSSSNILNTIYAHDTRFLIFDIRYNLISFFSKFFILKGLIKVNSIEIIHAHTQRAGFLLSTIKLLSFYKFKIIYTPHGLRYTQKNFFLSKLFHYLIDQYIYLIVDSITSISSSEFQLLKTKFLGNKDKVNHINTVINTDFKIDINILKSYPGKKIISMCGDLSERKQPNLFIEIAQIFNKTVNYEDFIFIWIGGDKNSQVLFNERVKISHINNLYFIGNLARNDALSIINSSTVILSTSNAEGFPLFILEAFALNKLVLSNSYSNVTDIIEPEINGLLFDYNNPYDAAEKLHYVIKHFSSYDNIRNNAYNTYLLNHSSYDIFANNFKYIYKSLSI